MNINRNGSSMQPEQYQEGTTVKLPRVTLDLKIPLWGVATAAAVMVTGLVGMYYKVDQMSIDVTELKATLRAINGETIKFAKEQAVLEFRVQKLEQGQGQGR